MNNSMAWGLGLIYVVSEIGLTLKKRAKAAEARGEPSAHRYGALSVCPAPFIHWCFNAFLGLALCLANWASLVILLVPVFLVFLRRMHVEEGALVQAFGNQYRDYMRRTKRLIPAVY
jgi:protein-S-isoprenylcysteine O-methyltransferase Ste14